MTLTPTELQLIGGGLVFATALGSYWYFKRRSDRAAANINKTEQHSEQFDKIAATLEKDTPKRRATDGRVAPGFEGSDRRKQVHPSRTRQGAIEEALRRERPHGAYPGPKPVLSEPRPPVREPLERFGAAPKPRLTPEQRRANRLREEQEEELRRRRRQNDDDSNLLTTMAVIQASSDDGGRSPGPTHSDSDSFKSGGGSFGGGGASASWGGDSSSSSSSSSDSSSSSSDSGSSSSSD